MLKHNYYSLSRREDVNIAVRHILAVNDIIDECSQNKNIADVISKMIETGRLKSEEIKPILSSLLLDKWNYKATSINLSQTLENPESFIESLSEWAGIDIVLGYEHPELGFLVINPKNPSSKIALESFKKNELLTIYLGYAGLQNKEDIPKELINATFKTILSLIKNNKATPPKAVLNGKFRYVEKRKNKLSRTHKSKVVKTKEETKESDTLKGQLKMSNLISVIVTNELFHNGNVEAWKRIIASYCTKYQNAKVLIFYEGEHITNINTLFKWGKVNHGSSIQFAVISDIHRDLSKLSKYLKEGASPRFEVFLHGTPDSILALF
jgi:hypothetical protein